MIDASFIRNFTPRCFDQFDFIPSVGAGGLLILWCSAIFSGIVVKKLHFRITVNFTSIHNGDVWRLSNIYGPCDEPEISEFISWFRSCDVNDTTNWLFLGDFNFYRSLEDRNKAGGILAHTLIFNDAIGHLGLIELSLKGRSFTGATCRLIPYLNNLTGFSPLPIGPLTTQIQNFSPWQK